MDRLFLPVLYLKNYRVNLKNSTNRLYLVFVILAFVILLIGLGSYGLAESSEARYAEISREMLLSGDYLNPQLLGIFHFHKPPITYYITTLGYHIFGINEFGARFFLQVAIAIQLLLVYGLANLLFRNRKVAFFSGLIYFSMPIVLISSRNLTTDAFLTTFVMAAIFCWQYYLNREKILFLYLFYMFVGLALLTKGPVALLFILVYIIAQKIIYKQGSRLNIHHVIGILLCLGLAISWFAAVMIENPKLWTYFVEKQIAGRITGNSFSERSEPFWFYIPILIGLLLPWIMGIIPKFSKKVKSLAHTSRENRLLLITSLLLFITFSVFSTKLILYILPIFWMIAIFIGSQLAQISKRSGKIINISYLVILNVLALSLLIIRFGSFEIIKVSTSAIIIALLVTIATYLFYFFINGNKKYKPALIAAMFGASIILISSAVLKINSPTINSTRHMAEFINNISKNEEKTILVYDYRLSSIPFYSDANFITIFDGNRTADREIQFQNDEKWKEHLWNLKDESSVSKLENLSAKPNTFLIMKNKRILNNNIGFFQRSFKYKKEYPKWTIYYNK